MDDDKILPGSEADIPDGARSAEAARRDEVIAISLCLRSHDKPLGDETGAIDRTELATSRATELRPTIQAICAYAQEVGLAVADEDPARLLMRLTGTVAAMERAFGVQLFDCDVGGRPCRCYRGSIHLPSRIIPLVTAVLGLDDGPAVQAR